MLNSILDIFNKTYFQLYYNLCNDKIYKMLLLAHKNSETNKLVVTR